MKKSILISLSLAVCLALSVMTWAGPFEHFYDYENQDGSYSYFFTNGIFVTMDKEWYQNTFVKIEERGATFFHKDSYDAYAAQGLEGAGRLFTIGGSVNTSFQELPSFEYIGFDEENAMNYYAELPTDYQGYPGDEKIRQEYDALWAGVKDVIAGIQIGSSDARQPESSESGELSGESDMHPEPAPDSYLVGGWEVTEDAAVTEEAREVFDQAVKAIEDVTYEPAALLATQVVAGLNYCFLGREISYEEVGMPGYCLIYIWKAPGRDAQLLETQPIRFGLSEQGGEAR